MYHSVISNLTKEYSINNKQCSQCDLLKFCEGNRCKFINYASTKQLHKPSARLYFTSKNFEIYRNEKLGNEEKYDAILIDSFTHDTRLNSHGECSLKVIKEFNDYDIKR